MSKNKKDDLKKEFEQKKRELDEAKVRAANFLKREKEKISKEVKLKIDAGEKILNKSLKKIGAKHEADLKKIEKKTNEVEKFFSDKVKKALTETSNNKIKATKDAAKATREIEELSAKEVKLARKRYISVEARVFSRRRRIKSALQFFGLIYLFILSVIIIKDASLALTNGSINTITSAVDSPMSALGAGWLSSIIAQSGSVIAILTNTLAGSEIINFNTAFYILLGISLGNSITPVLASLIIKSDHNWKLRRGFELGLANVIYSIFLVTLILIIQIPTSFFTKTGDALAVWANKLPAFQKIPDLLSVITDPVLNLLYFDRWPIIISLFVGLAILIFSLGRVGHSMFIFLGGKKHTRAIIEKYMGSHWRAFGIGLALTIIIPSASLLNTLLVPLAIARIVKLRQAVPYIIGTSVGTFIDVLMASFANAQGYAVAGGIVLTMMSALGIVFIFGNFGSTLIYRISRYLSLHVIKMRRVNILKYLAGYIIIPAIIILIF